MFINDGIAILKDFYGIVNSGLKLNLQMKVEVAIEHKGSSAIAEKGSLEALKNLRGVGSRLWKI